MRPAKRGGTLSWDGRPHFRGVTLPSGARELHATAASGRSHLSGARLLWRLVPPRALEKRGGNPKPRRHGPKRPRVTLSPTSGQLLRRRPASGWGKPHTRGLATLFYGPTTAVGSIQAAGLQGAGRPVRRLPDNEQVGQCLATRYLYCPRRWRSDTPDGRGAPIIAASSRRTRLRTGGKTGGGARLCSAEPTLPFTTDR